MRNTLLILCSFPILLGACKKDKFDDPWFDYSGISYKNLKIELALYHGFVIPENAVNNDYVGKFYTVFTYKPASNYHFTLTGGNTDAFAINSSSGMIYIKDNTKLKTGKEMVLVHTSDGRYTDIDTVEIKVIDENKCIFIDPDYSGSENGDREKPYNSWDDINGTYKPGYAYFQKRSTIARSKINVSGETRGAENEPIMIGAYGQGNRPEINGSNFPDHPGVNIGSWSDVYGEWVEVYSLVVYNCRGFETTPGTRHIKIYNCEGYNNSNNANFYLRHSYVDETIPLDVELRNIIAYNGASHGIKFMASGSRAYNCHTYDNKGSGFKFALESDGNYGEYILTHNNESNGITIDGDYAKILHSVSYLNSSSGYSFGREGHHNTLINSVAYSNNIHGVYMKMFTHDVNIMSIVSYNNGYHGIRITGEAYNAVIEKCELYSNKKNGLAINIDADGRTTANDVHNVVARYNVVYDNYEKGVEINNCSNITLHNNTIMKDDLYLAGTLSNVRVKNSMIENVNNENYLDFDNIVHPTDELFENYEDNNYRLKPTATIAIDKGSMMEGIISDFEGNPIVGLPDIGAWEHVANQVPVVPSDVLAVPVMNSSDISISWTDNSYDEKGFIIERSKSPAEEFVVVGNVIGDNFIDQGLEELTTYYYRVYAYNDNGTSEYSNVASVTTSSSNSYDFAGNMEVFSDVSVTTNLRAQSAIAPADGYLQSVSIYHDGGSGDMLLGIYEDVNGLPGRRLGITPQSSVNSSEGWQTIQLISPVKVTKDQPIWLAWVFETIPGIHFDIGTPGRAHANTEWSTGMPETFGDCTTDSYVYSIYASYTR